MTETTLDQYVCVVLKILKKIRDYCGVRSATPPVTELSRLMVDTDAVETFQAINDAFKVTP